MPLALFKGMDLSYRYWQLRRLVRGHLRSPLRALTGIAAVLSVLYLAQFWWVNSGARTRAARWTRDLLRTRVTGQTRAEGYVAAFDRCFQILRADRRVRLLRYEFPLTALRYQQAPASGWRLQSHRILLSGIAVPRAYRGLLDDHGILFIDPQTTPPEALANPNTPLPLAVLQRNYLLVPDLTGERRSAYQVLPWRQLSNKR